uniref:Starch-binding domain-containing protein 1 n=1 Tax=Oryzias latipes TaxID=8090 RepID=A0A3P9JV23_ORYLA
MVSHDKQNHSGVAPFPLLLLQPTDLQSDTCAVHPTHCLSQLVVGDEHSLNWCKDTKSVPLMCGKETRGEKNEDDTDPSMDHLVSSSYKVLEETYCEEANPGIPPEMGWIAGSFKEQKNNQMPSTDLPVFGTTSNADEACQIGFEKDELTCLPGAWRESGISSMTASLYLEEANYDPPTENGALSGTDLFPSFEEQTNAENTLFDGDKIAGEIRKDASNTSGTCLSMQHINGREQNVMDQFGEGEMLPIELKQGGIKKVENGENTGAVKANNGKTEISIREATMDTEWMVDDEEAHPWVNPSDPIVVKNVQTNHRCCSSLSEVEVSSDNEVKQTNTLYFVGGNGEKSNKVVAVQPMSQFVDVTFHIHYVTQSLYQKVAITGNQQELGNWKGFVPLEKTKDGHWATVVSLPAESHVEWKFVVVDKGEVCRWEECGNRLLETGSGDDLLIQKWWGFL